MIKFHRVPAAVCRRLAAQITRARATGAPVSKVIQAAAVRYGRSERVIWRWYAAGALLRRAA